MSKFRKVMKKHFQKQCSSVSRDWSSPLKERKMCFSYTIVHRFGKGLGRVLGASWRLLGVSWATFRRYFLVLVLVCGVPVELFECAFLLLESGEDKLMRLSFL